MMYVRVSGRGYHLPQGTLACGSCRCVPRCGSALGVCFGFDLSRRVRVTVSHVVLSWVEILGRTPACRCHAAACVRYAYGFTLRVHVWSPRQVVQDFAEIMSSLLQDSVSKRCTVRAPHAHLGPRTSSCTRHYVTLLYSTLYRPGRAPGRVYRYTVSQSRWPGRVRLRAVKYEPTLRRLSSSSTFATTPKTKRDAQIPRGRCAVKYGKPSLSLPLVSQT
jgi:hypothetical protein